MCADFARNSCIFAHAGFCVFNAFPYVFVEQIAKNGPKDVLLNCPLPGLFRQELGCLLACLFVGCCCCCCWRHHQLEVRTGRCGQGGAGMEVRTGRCGPGLPVKRSNQIPAEPVDGVLVNTSPSAPPRQHLQLIAMMMRTGRCGQGGADKGR